MKNFREEEEKLFDKEFVIKYKGTHCDNCGVDKVSGYLSSAKNPEDYKLFLRSHGLRLIDHLLKQWPVGKDENHLCRFNDGEQRCECHHSALQQARKLLEDYLPVNIQ